MFMQLVNPLSCRCKKIYDLILLPPAMSCDGLFINLHQHPVISFRRVLGFVFAPGFFAHVGKLRRMTEEPVNLGRQVGWVAGAKMEAGASVIGDLSDRSNVCGQHGRARGKGLYGHPSEGFVTD